MVLYQSEGRYMRKYTYMIIQAKTVQMDTDDMQKTAEDIARDNIREGWSTNVTIMAFEGEGIVEQ